LEFKNPLINIFTLSRNIPTCNTTMAPAQLDAAPISITQEHKPIMTKENKPPIPVGAGAKKAIDSYFTGINSTSSEFRQRSSSSSRTVLKSSSRGTTPSRDLPPTSNRDNCVDVEMLANALKKMPGLERNAHRPTPPRSRSISRAESPLPDAEMLDESLPDFYKVTLKKTDRTGSQTRDIVLDGHRQTSQAQRAPSVEPQMQRFRRGSFSGTSVKDGEEANLPEFKRVTLKRTPSREQLDDEATHRASTRKSNIVKEKSISSCGSYSSLTSINKTVLSRRSSVSEDRPEFLDVRLKKAGSRAASPDGDAIDDTEAKSSSMSRSGSYTTLANINRANWSRTSSLSTSDEPAFKGVALKKTGSKQDLSQNDLRSRASATPEPEFANVSLKKSKRVQGEQSKFELESVSLKPIPVGEVNDEEKNSEFTSMERVSRCRVERTTKFESGDDEYENIQSSLNRLKGVQIEESEEEREKRKEQERKEREERDKERKEREEKAKLEREAREKADKEARERREKRAREQKETAIKEQKEREEMEKKLKAEMEQKREEMEKVRKEKEERAKAEKEQREREMKEQEEKQRKEREERLRKEKEEREQKQQEERERKEQLKKQEAKIAEEERKIREEQKEKEKQERKEKIRLEIEGKVKHKAEEKERKEKEREERVEEKLKLNEDAEEKTLYYRRRRSSEEKESSKARRNNLIKRMSFTSCENINLSSQPDSEKVHLSVFSREMGSNHDLVQICQDQGQGKHEVKLQFMLGQREEEEKEKQKEEKKEEESEEEEETSEEVVVIQRLERTESRLTKAFEDAEKLVECSGSQSTGSKRLNPLRKAPSVDGLFQTQEVNAAFTFKLPPEQQQQQQPKLSFQLPTIA